ncbi:MAG: protein kinase [Planctomycetes bacterium]|nr:protein kinase [Planctomycetota bacterium]
MTVEISPNPLRSAAQRLLQQLQKSSLIRGQDWDGLTAADWADLKSHTTEKDLLAGLVERKLLTRYQAARIAAGKTFGLILGNYRVLDRLGAGAMGVVFKAEHLRLPRLAAVKVLPVSNEQDPRYLQRFHAEMWAAAQLQHPNIVRAIDAGSVASPRATSPTLHYFVMDYVAGQDLDAKVRQHGPLSPAMACDLIHQVAGALSEAHKQNLVHRDIKPSNVLVTPEGQAKLLDFGLARQLDNRLTTPGTMLGTLDYVAPEQARDASGVDIRADIYGLGGTLFWCLTGQAPFPSQGNVTKNLLSRFQQRPPSVRAVRPEIPAALDHLVARMLATDPDDRFSTPQALMQALLPFCKSASSNSMLVHANAKLERDLSARDNELTQARNALVWGLAELICQREPEPNSHFLRLQRYCRCLAEEAGAIPDFGEQVDEPFIELLECCAPLHDIGKIGLPDHILLKPGKLTAEERLIMQTHTTNGADVLRKLAKQHRVAASFLRIAIDIAQSHHERYDGAGYPDGLLGSAIPLAARIVTICDVYDALRSRRAYRPALSHSAAHLIMVEGSPGQFDPQLLCAFQGCASRFEQIAKELAD